MMMAMCTDDEQHVGFQLTVSLPWLQPLYVFDDTQRAVSVVGRRGSLSGQFAAYHANTAATVAC